MARAAVGWRGQPAKPGVMYRSTLLVSAVAACLAGALLQAQQPGFRAAADTVPLYATVVHEDGEVARDLTRDDFEVYDNGRLQPITVFDAGERPISIVVMLDRSATMEPHAARVEAGARAFVASLRPDDRARIGTFGEYIRIRPDEFTSDRAVLQGLIDKSPLPSGATPLWRATSNAFDALANEPGQRVVLLFTDGRDTPAFSEHVTFDRILERVQREETMVYAVGLAYRCPSRSAIVGPGGVLAQMAPRGPLSRPAPLPRPPQPFPGMGRPPQPAPSLPSAQRRSNGCRETGPDPNLRELARVGGGGYFELRSTDDLLATFERVSHELHNQYLIGFAPPESDGQLHNIDVRVTRPGLSVRARRTYLAPSE